MLASFSITRNPILSFGESGISVTDIALLIWVTGQVALQIIQALKGQAVTPQQSEASANQFTALMNMVQGHGQQISQLAQNQLPPTVTRDVVSLVGRVRAANPPVAKPPPGMQTTTATVTTTEPVTGPTAEPT